MANYLDLINCLRGLKTVIFCLSSDWVVFVNTWQKGGEIVDMWESYLFCLGGVEIVFGRGRYYVSCFTLLIDLYLWVIHDICLYCVLCEIKNLFLFSCIFQHAFMRLLSILGNIQVDLVMLLSTLATDG